MIPKKARRGITGIRVATAAFLATALSLLAGVPAARADVEDTPLDEAVDNSFQDIANFFNPEPPANVFAIDNFSDLLAPEGTPIDQMIDAFYQSISTVFQPEGQLDMFLESLLGAAAF